MLESGTKIKLVPRASNPGLEADPVFQEQFLGFFIARGGPFRGSKSPNSLLIENKRVVHHLLVSPNARGSMNSD